MGGPVIMKAKAQKQQAELAKMLLRFLPPTAEKLSVLILGTNDDLGPEKDPLLHGCDREMQAESASMETNRRASDRRHGRAKG